MIEYAWQVAGAAKMTGCRMESQRKKLVFQEKTQADLLKKLCCQPELPHLSLDDFRRGDGKTKMYLLNSILAVLDAGLATGNNTAVTDHSHAGSLVQNQAYLADYIQYGRIFGRGHLFVGTLPSTPVCEAAISLGYHGAVYYLDTHDDISLYWQEIELLLQDHPAVLAFHYQAETLYTFCMIPGNTAVPEQIEPEELFAGGQRS